MAKMNYILGLDIGIASVGWSVVEINANEEPQRLIDLGVRTFERAEVPKTGDSLAKERRLARSQRRLTRRRAFRLLRLRRLLKREGILFPSDFNQDGFVINLPNQVWQLRCEGLDRKLDNKEWAAVLLHLVKRRGYLSQRKSEKNTTDKELGALLSGVNTNHALLTENAEQFRTAAELAVKYFEKETGYIRNQRGGYQHTFNRLDLNDELNKLFAAQRRFGNPHTSPEFRSAVENLLMTQRAALSGDAVLKMLGKCTLEPEEYKAAKNTYSAERFVWLTKLNNLRIGDTGREYALNPEQRAILLDMPYKQSSLKYSQVRKALGLPETAHFKGLRYEKDNAENSVLMEMKAWHAIRKAMESNGLKTEWQSLATKPELLDAIGTAFSVYKTDTDISAALNDRLPENILDVLLEHLKFDKFIHLSLTALNKILPLMEQGARYDEACEQIYGSHTETSPRQATLYLPPIPADEIRNAVVLRSLSQTRKVINAVIRRYGSPARIHIETGRDVGKTSEDRKKIEKQQEENRKSREKAVEKFKEQFPHFVGEPSGQDILKMRLYHMQHGKCLYSETPIDLRRLPEKGYVEIDHALPFSRTWDDSFNNKVLVLGSENQKKGDKTPYEYLDGANNSERWRRFVANVSGSLFSHGKKQRIMLHELDEKGFKERNLTDTRYINRFLCQFISHNLLLTGQGTNRVFPSNGQITNLLRGRWGLAKDRDKNDRHHALDAVVVACSTVAMQQRITHYVREKEMNVFSGTVTDKETGEIRTYSYFPQPWEHFRKEVMIRVFSDNPQQALAEQLPGRPQAQHEYVAPLFVSRAPTRKMSGQGHMETIKSAKRLDENISVLRVPLTQLKPSDLENMVNRYREPELYEALKARLEAYDNKPEKAFATEFRKKGGQIVKAIRVEQVQKSGVLLHNGNGIADNASMPRVDVFEKNGKFYLVPIYTWQIAKGILPNKAATQGKDEANWDIIDDSYTFRFSLFPNDLVEVRSQKDRIFGYYVKMDRANASIAVREHDLDITKGKDGIHRTGVKTALSFKKYQIDELGKNITECRPKKRQNVR